MEIRAGLLDRFGLLLNRRVSRTKAEHVLQQVYLADVYLSENAIACRIGDQLQVLLFALKLLLEKRIAFLLRLALHLAAKKDDLAEEILLQRMGVLRLDRF